MPASDLLAVLVSHCRSALPEGTQILQPGDALQSPPTSAWAEFWIDRVTSPVSRRSSPRETEFSLTINCFARPPRSVTAATQLAAALSDCLRHSIVPLDAQVAARGSLRLREPELRDISRPITAKSAGLWHWIITISGTAPAD